MKTYTLDLKTSVITQTPNVVSFGVLHDAPSYKSDKELLKEEFSDLHLLFLSKVVRLGQEATLTKQEKVKLSALFQKMIKIKLLLQEDE